MLGKRIRHIHRYQEIVNAFIRNGFAFLVKELGLAEMFSIKKKWASEQKYAQKRSLGEKVRSFLEELGPSFVKLGQIASTRPDLIPQEVVKELEKLQDHVQPFSFAEVKQIIEAELGNKLEHLFLEFNEEPLAAASIGQVHDAVLPSNKRVAVKVQRPNMKTTVETDLEIIGHLARMAENRFAWAAKYHLTEIVEEFSNALRQELDYDNEARNAERISRYCAEEPYLVIPEIHWEYSTKKVLTSDYIDGIKISQNKTLDQLGYNRKVIAERFTNIMLKQMLLDGFFHGDPHPGNIVILPNETIGMVDFGMVGRLNAEIKYHFASLVIAMRRQSTDGILKAIASMGLIEPDTKIEELRMDIEDLQEKYYQEALSQIHFGEAINELFSIAFKHHIQFPADLTLLGKTLLTMEGIVESLDPQFNMMGAAEPFGKKLLQERYHPKTLSQRFWHHAIEYSDILIHLPKNIKELTVAMQKGKFRSEITVPDLDTFLNKLDKIGNRLSSSIVLLSFSIMMVGLIIGSSIAQDTLIWKLPVIEIGFVIAAGMVIWLLYSIIKSGRRF